MKHLILLLLFYVSAISADGKSGILNSNVVKKMCDEVVINGVYEAKDSTHNYRNFILDCKQSGKFYIFFWIQASMCSDGNVAKFKVFLNGNKVGEIHPNKSGWQVAKMENNKNISLNKGKHTLSISSLSPDFPDVEMIHVSSNADDNCINANEYEAYQEKAKRNEYITDYKNHYQCDNYVLSAYTSQDFQEDIPIKYSFFKRHSFKEGEELSVNSASRIQHCVDVFYIGQPYNFNIANSASKANEFNTNNCDGTTIEPPLQLKPVFIPASTEEMQGLSWKRNPIVNLDSGSKVFFTTSMKIRIPKTGLYIIKARSIQNGMLGTVDISINGKYEYDAPIYYSAVNCIFPADDNNYAVLTKADDIYSDPMLFVEGNMGNRIVGFADDNGNDNIKSAYGLGLYDAYLSQVYKIRTSNMHVTNYNSLSPEKTCVLKGFLEEGNQLGKAMANITCKKEEQGNKELAIYGPQSVMPTSVAQFSSPIEITNIQAFDMHGRLMSTATINSSKCTVSIHMLGLHKKGVYILIFNTREGKISRKIVVR